MSLVAYATRFIRGKGLKLNPVNRRVRDYLVTFSRIRDDYIEIIVFFWVAVAYATACRVREWVPLDTPFFNSSRSLARSLAKIQDAPGEL